MRIPIDQELVRTVARIRKYLDEGYTLTQITKLTGWPKDRVWRVKEGVCHAKTSLPINELELQKPSSSGVRCRKCGDTARIFCKSLLCVQCELFELDKLGLVVINEPDLGG